MAVREILQLGNPLLRKRSAPVDLSLEAAEVERIVEDLRDTVISSFQTTGYGRGIAAPQIGEMKRVVYLSAPEPLVLINPEIVERSLEEVEVWDACLSFLAIFMKVRRHREIVVRYLTHNGMEKTLRAGAEFDLSELLQHEIDHLDGILAIDRIVDLRTICIKEEFERRFRQHSPYCGRTAEDGLQ